MAWHRVGVPSSKCYGGINDLPSVLLHWGWGEVSGSKMQTLDLRDPSMAAEGSGAHSKSDHVKFSFSRPASSQKTAELRALVLPISLSVHKEFLAA